jgi:ABC-type antimicrobial peptide transport system, ATPase component
MSSLNEKIIEMKNIVKSFYIGTPHQLDILKNINITVREGEFVSIVGASGSGKSTLMNIIGALDRQTSGTYILDNFNITEVSDDGLSQIRNKKIGFVFQTFNLIPRSTALKNVELPMLYAGMGRKERLERAESLLTLVGMEDRITHVPNELSGGQKQRVAIARALSNDPSIILADEPTGALDSSTGRLVMDLFHKVHELEGKTIILITHNQELAEETERIITIKDGKIVSEQYNDMYIKKFPSGKKVCL